MTRSWWARLWSNQAPDQAVFAGTRKALRDAYPIPTDEGDEAMRRLIEQMKTIEGSEAGD